MVNLLLVFIFLLGQVEIYGIRNNNKTYLKNRRLYNYMEKLSQYDEATQQFIVNVGTFMYDKSKTFFEDELMESKMIEKWDLDFNIDKIRNEKKRLEDKLREKENENMNLKSSIYKARDEEREKYEKSATWYKVQLEEMQKITKLKETNYEKDINERINRETEQLNKNIEDLKKKNKWYYDLYESKEKGTNYEEELYPKMLDYNDKYLNSGWAITHIGQVMGEKSDFHFKHKETDNVILIDTKNNLPTNPIASTDNFVRDVTDKKTNAIGGIMLANGRICNKKSFEINMVNDKCLMYVSNFDRNNIEYIFSLLDEINELTRLKKTSGDKDRLKDILIENYKREIQQIESIEKTKKITEKNIESIVEDFQKYFNEDITMEIKKGEISSSSVRSRKKTSKDVVDFEELESDRVVVGKRSKYYLQFEENGEKKIQYFSNNWGRNEKVKKLEKKNETGENTIIVM